MSWLGQVGHVMAKDVRQTWWAVALVLLAVAGGTLRALDVGLSHSGEIQMGTARVVTEVALGTPALLIAGLLLVALLVHADSPARSDAFWATRPLVPSAVLAAKVVLMATLLLLLPLGAQLWALVAHEVPADRIPGLLGASALEQAGLVAVAAALASLTADLRSYVVAIMVATFAWSMILAVAAGAFGNPVTYGPRSSVTDVVWLVAGAALVTYQYHVRDVRRVATVAAAPVAAALLLLAAIPPQRPIPVRREAVPPHLRAEGLGVADMDVRPEGLGMSQVILRLELSDGRPGYRYALWPGDAHIRLPDGSEARAVASQRMTLHQSGDAGLEGFIRLDEGRGPPFGLAHLAFSVPRDVGDVLEREGASGIELTGDVEVLEPSVVGMVPLEVGAAVARGGYRIRVESVEPGPEPIVNTVAESVERSRSWWGRVPFESLEFFLVNEERKELLALHLRSGGGGQSHVMVLSGVEARAYRAGLGTMMGAARQAGLPRGWMDAAALYVREWTPIGSYPVSVTLRDLELEGRRARR